MINELIPFMTKNGNRYFYDPLLREVFIYQAQTYRERAISCEKKTHTTERLFKRITGKEVEYQLANLPQITIEMTEKCNLNCFYCGYGHLYTTIDRTGADIPFSYLRNILVFLNEKLNSSLNVSDNTPFYISFYGGEPLLCFERIQETVELANRMNFANNALVFSMTSNGFFLDKYMDYLVEHKFRLLLSLDGDREGNRLRVDHKGNSQFDRILKNINALRDKYPEYFKTHVNFNAVLNRYNSVESITHFIESHFDKPPSIAPVNPQGLEPGKVSDFLNIYTSASRSFEDADRVMDSKEKYFINHPEVKEVFLFLRDVCGNTYSNYNSLLVKERKRPWPTGTCLPFQKRMFVSAKGLLLPCENVSHKQAFGYVDEKGVALDSERIADIYNQAFEKLRNQCVHCYGKDTCSRCIFQMEPKFTCGDMITKKDVQEKFSKAVTFVEDNPVLYSRLMKEVSVE